MTLFLTESEFLNLKIQILWRNNLDSYCNANPKDTMPLLNRWYMFSYVVKLMIG